VASLANGLPARRRCWPSSTRQRAVDTATELQHVFVLFVYLGMGVDRKLASKDMMFADLNDCLWYSQKLHAQGGNVTSYCLPKLVTKGLTKVY